MARLYVAGELVDANWPEPKRASTGNHVYYKSRPVWDECNDYKVHVVVLLENGNYAVFRPNVYWGRGLRDRSKVDNTWYRVHYSELKENTPEVYLLERMILN